MSMLDFDTESFILAVKERPVIWDMSAPGFSNRTLRKEAWDQITEMYGGSECTTAREKEDLSTNLQKKWRHLKDSFCRENRRLKALKSGSSFDKKKPYVYYNILSFINSGMSETDIDGQPETEDAEMEEVAETPRRSVGLNQSRVAFKRKSVEVGKQARLMLKTSPEKHVIRSSRHSFAENNEIEDDDKLFLMSILKDFKRIPEELKLSAKRQILCVIEEHQSSIPNAAKIGDSTQTQTTSAIQCTTWHTAEPGPSTETDS